MKFEEEEFICVDEEQEKSREDEDEFESKMKIKPYIITCFTIFV
jgi:hypothetical protein